MKRDHEIERIIGLAVPELAGNTAIVLDVPDTLMASDTIAFAMPHTPPQFTAVDPSLAGSRLIAISAEVPKFDVWASVVHEIAHSLPARPVKSIGNPAAAILAFAKWTATNEPPKTYSRPWQEDHGPRFIRAAIHLVHRLARWLPPWVRLDDALPRHYGLSPLSEYAARLGNEPKRCYGLTFAEIEAIEPPAAFNELFESDVQSYLKEKVQNANDAA